MLETIVSIFIGGALDGKNVDHKINGDIKTDGEIYFLREYWMRDGIGGTVHAIKFLISSNISDREAVFRIEQHLTHNAEQSVPLSDGLGCPKCNSSDIVNQLCEDCGGNGDYGVACEITCESCNGIGVTGMFQCEDCDYVFMPPNAKLRGGLPDDDDKRSDE